MHHGLFRPSMACEALGLLPIEGTKITKEHEDERKENADVGRPPLTHAPFVPPFGERAVRKSEDELRPLSAIRGH
jgi:hypothetical protein